MGELRIGKFCRGCQYALEGLRSRECPECGKPFDPEDHRTYDTRPGGTLRIPVEPAALVGSVIAIGAFMAWHTLQFAWISWWLETSSLWWWADIRDGDWEWTTLGWYLWPIQYSLFLAWGIVAGIIVSRSLVGGGR